MSGYSHRRSGAPDASGGYDAMAIPRAPRTPNFAPQMVPANGAYRVQPTHPIPAPANSLSPVAMASARNAVATGGYAAQDTQEVKARPSAKAGFSILLAGAIIGGLIGAVMHARDSAVELLTKENTHETVVGGREGTDPPGLPPGAVSSLPNGVLPPLIPPADKVSDKTDVTPEKKPKKGGFVWKPRAEKSANGDRGGVDKSAADAIEKDEKPASTAKGKKKKVADDDGYTVAGAGNSDDKPEPPKAEKAEKPAKKAAKDDEDAPPPKKKGGKKNDAESVLRAAMGATENTL